MLTGFLESARRDSNDKGMFEKSSIYAGSTTFEGVTRGYLKNVVFQYNATLFNCSFFLSLLLFEK